MIFIAISLALTLLKISEYKVIEIDLEINFDLL